MAVFSVFVLCWMAICLASIGYVFPALALVALYYILASLYFGFVVSLPFILGAVAVRAIKLLARRRRSAA